MSFGVDYSFSRPKVADLKAKNVSFVLRYTPTYDAKGNEVSKKGLTYEEAKSLNSAGIKCGLVFESYAARAAEGFKSGAADATTANLAAKSLKPGCVLYFAVDFNPSSSEMSHVVDYFKGICSVLDVERVGVYGGYATIAAISKAGVASQFWQTYAWSNGKWHPAANLRQYLNGQTIGGAGVDFCSLVDPAKPSGLWVLDEFEPVKPAHPDVPTGIPGGTDPAPTPVTPPAHTTVYPLKAGHIFGYKPKHLSLALLARVHDGKAGTTDRNDINRILKRFNRVPNGYFTAQLHADVMKWQKKVNLPVNGAVDPATWKALGL
jgi:peptidoglycan hydrolase-like protein with peptidoglycan-binding domain